MTRSTGASLVGFAPRLQTGILVALLLGVAAAACAQPLLDGTNQDLPDTGLLPPAGAGDPGEAARVDKDYFLRTSNPDVAQIVGSVEFNHLSNENFWTKYRRGEVVYARGDLRFVLKYVPNHPRALFLLGELSRGLHEVGFPIPFFERAIRLFPQYAYTRMQYGMYLASIGQIRAGRELLQEALRMDPSLVLASAALRSLPADSTRDAGR